MVHLAAHRKSLSPVRAGILTGLFIRFGFTLVARGLFRIRIVGRENIPNRGPAVLVANHVTFLDGFLIGYCVRPVVRFLVWRPYYHLKVANWALRLVRAIPIGTRLHDLADAMRSARRALQEGNVVCIFAEGYITRTGNLLPFKRGFERVVRGLDVPIVPIHMDRLWGSAFSFGAGRSLWKRLRAIRHTATLSFGAPLPPFSTANEVRQAIQELGAGAASLRKANDDVLALQFIRSARRHWRRLAAADAGGQELTYGQLCIRSLVLARRVPRYTGSTGMVGVLLPPSVDAAVANIGVIAGGRIPVNLDCSAAHPSLAPAIAQCGLSTILTSRAFLAGGNIAAPASVVLLEDIFAGTGGIQKVLWMAARWLPARLLLRFCGAGHMAPDSLATVIFPAGGLELRRGVMLSHYNILSNIDATRQVLWVGRRDRIVSAWPVSDAFGLTVAMWFPLLSGRGVVYAPARAAAEELGHLARDYRCTFLIPAPGVDGAGLERLGVKPIEGYSCPELAGVISLNTPDRAFGGEKQVGTKRGTVGHPLPGVALRVVDPVDMQLLPAGRPGLLLVKAPSRMLGYLGEPETSAARLDGWHVTGDVGVVDPDGFLRITHRKVTEDLSPALSESLPPSKSELESEEQTLSGRSAAW